jgi:regulator of RNase E activity RraA
MTDARLDAETECRLRAISCATLTSQLLKRGFRNTFIRGLRTSRPDLKMMGVAFTVRYVPTREDLGFHVDYDNTTDVQRLAVERIDPGHILVIDARGSVEAASFGHIIATRIGVRGAAGLVTDGALRDSARFPELSYPAYYRAPHATTSSVVHYAADMNVPIGCGGVLVLPGDVLVGDAEGVVVIPRALAAEVAVDGLAQERQEEYSLHLVRAGGKLPGVYPLAAERRDEAEAWLATQDPD